MGLDQKVTLSGNVPSFSSWTALLAARQLSVQIRMIDGELAFPDEIPGEAWKELRVSLTQGMITLRREEDGVRVVTWGNSSGEALREWKMTTWAIAKAGDGRILTETGSQTADEYALGESL